MFCSQCGLQIAINDKFCGRCGTLLVRMPGEVQLPRVTAPKPPMEGLWGHLKLKRATILTIGLFVCVLLVAFVALIEFRRTPRIAFDNASSGYVNPGTTLTY